MMLNQVHGFGSPWIDWIGLFLVFGWQSLVPGGCGYRLVCGAESALTHDTTEWKWVSKHHSGSQGVNGCQVRFPGGHFGWSIWSIPGHKFTESSGQLTYVDMLLGPIAGGFATKISNLGDSTSTESGTQLSWWCLKLLRTFQSLDLSSRQGNKSSQPPWVPTSRPSWSRISSRFYFLMCQEIIKLCKLYNLWSSTYIEIGWPILHRFAAPGLLDLAGWVEAAAQEDPSAAVLQEAAQAAKVDGKWQVCGRCWKMLETW